MTIDIIFALPKLLTFLYAPVPGMCAVYLLILKDKSEYTHLELSVL